MAGVFEKCRAHGGFDLTTPLILLTMLAFAFAATYLEQLILGPRVRLLAGMEYLVIGFLCGPVMLGLLSEEQALVLEPLESIISGFIGFTAGIPLRWRDRKAADGQDVAFGIITAGLTMALIGGAAYVALAYQEGLASVATDTILVAAIVLGVGAAVSSFEYVSRGIDEAQAAGPVSRLLPTAAATIQVLAILAVGFSLSAHREPVGGGDFALHPLAWIGVDLVAGVGSGVIFHIFVGRQADDHKLFVATIGLVALASGIAHALAFSPLSVGLVAGATIANISPTATNLARSTERLQRPAYVILVLLAGATWVPIPAAYWGLAAAFVALRYVALRVAARTASLAHRDIDRHTRGLGGGLLSQGALAVALALNYQMVEDARLTPIVVTSLLLSAVVNQIWAGTALRRLLRNAGETGRRHEPVPEAAPDEPEPAPIEADHHEEAH